MSFLSKTRVGVDISEWRLRSSNLSPWSSWGALECISGAVWLGTCVIGGVGSGACLFACRSLRNPTESCQQNSLFPKPCSWLPAGSQGHCQTQSAGLAGDAGGGLCHLWIVDASGGCSMAISRLCICFQLQDLQLLFGLLFLLADWQALLWDSGFVSVHRKQFCFPAKWKAWWK